MPETLSEPSRRRYVVAPGAKDSSHKCQPCPFMRANLEAISKQLQDLQHHNHLVEEENQWRWTRGCCHLWSLEGSWLTEGHFKLLASSMHVMVVEGDLQHTDDPKMSNLWSLHVSWLTVAPRQCSKNELWSSINCRRACLSALGVQSASFLKISLHNRASNLLIISYQVMCLLLWILFISLFICK